jgi:hypothetical protein
MSDSKYKTVFVKSEPVGKGFQFKMSVNGDQLAINMQVSIEEMEKKGFEVFELRPVNGFMGSGNSSMLGMMILFKKK